ncbi:MAG TPA: hypothetical protein VMS30_06840 [Phycisphaerales bacterium]|nr:hypothetical protein [Phycisphaerales bacterium]
MLPRLPIHVAIFAPAALLLTVVGASAQSINFDYSTNFGAPPHPWYNAPSDSYGGAHGQTGHWVHSEAFNVWSNLAGLDGNPTNVDLTMSGGGPVSFFDHPSLSGDFETMMGDWVNVAPNNPITLQFTNLTPGVYTVYTYSNTLDCSSCRADVGVVPSSDGVQTVGGALSSNATELWLNYTRHRVYTASGVITIGIAAHTIVGAFNGIQLVFHGKVNPRVYVDAATVGNSGFGVSWSQACFRLDDALTIAQVSGQVDEVWVADGTYRTTRSGDRNVSFVVADGLKVYGGFAGGETQLGQRDPVAHPAILSGNINFVIFDTDNSCHVVDMSNTGSGTRLDGFRISGGYATVVGSGSFGGGVYMPGSSATVRRCVILNNHAIIGGGVWSDGDAPHFADCTFYNNDSYDAGGGARIQGGASIALFYNCLFAGNDAGGLGGGVSSNGQQTWFVNCVYTGNTTAFDGGAINAAGETADVLMVNTTLAGNSAASTCGGIFVIGGADDDLANCILWGNTDADPLTNTRQAQYHANDASSTQTLNYNIVQGWNLIAGIANNGNNPLFVDADGADNTVGTLDDDVHVQLTSPAIDSGNNADIPFDFVDLDEDNVLLEATPVDFDHRARRKDVASVVDTGAGSPPVVDRGPFEAVTPCPADINGDGVVDVNDLLTVITNWLAVGPNPGDINGDNIVDVNDLLAVVSTWGTCP